MNNIQYNTAVETIRKTKSKIGTNEESPYIPMFNVENYQLIPGEHNGLQKEQQKSLSEKEYTKTTCGNINYGLNSKASWYHSWKDYHWLKTESDSNTIWTNLTGKNLLRSSHTKLSNWRRWRPKLIINISKHQLTLSKQMSQLHQEDLITPIKENPKGLYKFPKVESETNTRENKASKSQTSQRKKDWPSHHYRVMKSS